MWICQATPTYQNGPPIKTQFYQYKKIDSKTNQIFKERIRTNENPNEQLYHDWSRIKIQSIDIKQVIKHLKQNHYHFLDPSFPQDMSVLTKGIFNQNVKWIRVGKLIQHAVYSKQQTSKCHQKIQLNRKALEQALIMMARANPFLYNQLISRVLNKQGIYQFKLFYGGIIHNVVIDDYIPSINDLPIFVGPMRNNEVFAMLLEKAMAKVCGCYEDIPQQTQDLLQMLFCGPVSKNNIKSLKMNMKLQQYLKQVTSNKQLAVLTSNNDPKIRRLGLNQGQYKLDKPSSNIIKKTIKLIKKYINHRNFNQNNSMKNSLFKQTQSTLKKSLSPLQISNDKQKTQIVYECVNQSKVSGWNGKYSLNNQIWNQIDSSTKFSMFHILKNNKSFLITEQDISNNFSDILVFQNLSVNNKIWIQGQSQSMSPTFITFQVHQEDSIFFRITTPYKIRQTIIFVKQSQNYSYSFLDSKFNQKCKKIQISAKVTPGKYIIAVYHTWSFSKSGIFSAFLQSHSHINMNKINFLDKDFLQKSILNYQQQKSKQTKKQQYSIHLQIQKLGMAYIIVNPTLNKNKTTIIEVDKNQLDKQYWTILQPFSNLSTIKITQHTANKKSIIFLTKQQILQDKKYFFPTAAFTLKK